MCVLQTPPPFDGPPRTKPGVRFIELMAKTTWGPDYRPTQDQHMVLGILQSLWASSVMDWLSGFMSPAQVEERSRFASERLVAGDA
jgi:hypothetical protein